MAGTRLVIATTGMNSAHDPDPVEHRQLHFRAPEGAAQLLLIRHGESAPARDGVSFPLVNGRSDPDLAVEGRGHAEALAHRLCTEQIDDVYVTPLRRTAQTAEPLLRRLERSARVEPDLQEVYLGEWEGGLLRKYVREQHPLAVRMREEQRWDVIDGAESMDEITGRVRSAVERIATRHPEQRVAVFSHGGVIATALRLACGAEPFAFENVDNGSISELVVSGTDWTVRRFNDTAHLDATD